MNHAEQVASILLKEKAVFLRPHDPFTWTSGIKSPVYCDNRLLISTVDSREYIIKAFAEAVKALKVDVVAGTATAGIPWAAWIAQELKLPLIYVRSSSKDHGRQNAIEGASTPGQKTVLIEDLISTGKSSIAAGKKLEEAGLSVLSIMSIFTYDFPQAQEVFRQANFKYQSLSNFEVLAKVAYDNKMLDTQALQNVLEWRKSVVFP
ncbi:orotate phosphoribosyltransferase [Peredibacter starrii]|uniref:Orotate phosphoribosyltransferase n=1 Tax=Peredibacter starrii TaxID=28202 RepID=A0AAX4HSB1_9BACT|nr:orotate phosphoribosyltransferase [Peredibacter starrii]WPU66276.1 orotate phosphoribosyltransferase [Peredibacter starrii]